MNLKRYLKEKNINLSKLATNAEIPYGTLHNGIENPRSLKSDNLKKIADVLNLSMDQVYTMLHEDKVKTLLDILIEQKEAKLKGNLYHHTQIIFTYNTNRIEGSKLTEDETRYIYETNTLVADNPSTKVDDIIETANHFYLFDMMLNRAKEPLSEEMIKGFHSALKSSTSDSRLDWFNVGEYKKLPNEVGGKETTEPKKVAYEIRKLLLWYNSLEEVNVEDIIEFHYRFEIIHPFQDGNGRVGRLIMFKECLKHNIVPFLIEDDYKGLYYRGLSQYLNEKGYLIDTCLTMQDKYGATIKKFLNEDE